MLKSGCCVMYAELAVTTNFSFLRGASHAEELVACAKRLGLSGIGIADRNSVAGVVPAPIAAQAAGLPPPPWGPLRPFPPHAPTFSPAPHPGPPRRPPPP